MNILNTRRIIFICLRLTFKNNLIGELNPKFGASLWASSETLFSLLSVRQENAWNKLFS